MVIPPFCTDYTTAVRRATTVRGGEGLKRLIEWFDAFVYDHQGLMLILDIAFIAVAVVCTLINVRVLLH